MIEPTSRLIHGFDMGLYDRDYMRKDSPARHHDGVELNRLSLRRKKLIMVGLIILLAGFVLALMV